MGEREGDLAYEPSKVNELGEEREGEGSRTHRERERERPRGESDRAMLVAESIVTFEAKCVSEIRNSFILIRQVTTH